MENQQNNSGALTTPQTSSKLNLWLRSSEGTRTLSRTEAIKGTLQVSKVNKENRLELIAYLSAQINDTAAFLGAKSNFTSVIITDCADMIAQTYWYFKLEEIRRFFYELKNGLLGKVYGELSAGQLMYLLSIYEASRADFVSINQDTTPTYLSLDELFASYKNIKNGEDKSVSHKPKTDKEEESYRAYKVAYFATLSGGAIKNGVATENNQAENQ